MGATPGKPSYSPFGVILGQLSCASKYTRSLNLSALEGDFTGQTFVVTGASAGIGFACAQTLLQRRAREVHVLCRDLKRGEAAVELLRTDVPGSAVLHQVDVGNTSDVRNFVTSLSGPVDGLVNNAGGLVNKRMLSSEAVESHVASHILGVHAMTKALAPKLADGARVVNVASAGLYTAKLDMVAIEEGFQGLEGTDGSLDGALAYAVCKRAQLELTKLWAAKLPSQKVYAMHPGWCKTAGLDGLFEAHPSYKVGFENWRSAADGADTIVWLLGNQAPDDACGGFFFDREQVEEHQWFASTQSSAEDIQRLWKFCEAKTHDL